MAILYAVLGISVLVIAHESGHYFLARAFKMRVLRYSIGFGPPLFRWRPKGSPTTFQICAIPFLAYVQIAGMNPAEDVDPNDPEIFPNKSLFARMMTIFAGPLANYLVAAILAFGVALTGVPQERTIEPMTVGQDPPKGTPAERADLLEGDIIRMAAGQKVRNVADLRRINKQRGARATDYVIERNGATRTVSITPTVMQGSVVLGVTARSETDYVAKPIGEAALWAVTVPAVITVAQIVGIADMIKNWDSRGLMGPVGMTDEVRKSVDKGPTEYVMILVILSVALGLFNLLPVPALDGGRLIFLFYEMITRRRPNERIEAVVHTVGLLFLLVIVALVSVREIGKLIG